MYISIQLYFRVTDSGAVYKYYLLRYLIFVLYVNTMDHLCEVIPRGEHFPRPVHIAYALDKALFRHPVQDGIEDILAFLLASGMFFNPSSFISRSMSIRERTNISPARR